MYNPTKLHLHQTWEKSIFFGLLRRAHVLIGCIALCVGIALVSLFVNITPWATRIDVGNEQFIAEGRTTAFQNYYGFYEPENVLDGSNRRFRWTTEQARVTFISAMRVQPVMLDLVLCGCQGQNTQTPVRLNLNNTYITTFNATNTWMTYHIAVPQTLAHPEYSLMVELLVPTRTSQEGRQLGIALDQVVLRQIAPARLADPLSIVLVLIAIVGLSAWSRSLRLPALLAAGWLIVMGTYQPQILPRWVVGALFIAGIIALWQFSRSIPWSSVGAAIVAVWIVLSPQILGSWLVDDAFISFRYAQQFIHGNGLVFNIGERVEGYTNFLWTMVLAAIMAIGGDPVVVAPILTLALAFVSVILTVALGQRILSAPWSGMAGLLVAVSGPFLLYTSRGSGMETALFSALTLASLLALTKQRWWLAGFLTALTLLTRPDGIVLAAVCSAYTFWIGGDTFTARLRKLLAYALPLAGIYGSYFIWRWTYYGYLLPNTFYVKVGGSEAQFTRGITYLWNFGRADLLLFAGALGAAIGVWTRWRRTRAPASLLLIGCFTLVFSCYIVVVGGDWMPGARFCIPLIPLLAILWTWGLAGLAERTRSLSLPAYALAAALIAAIAYQLPNDSSYRPNTDVWHENDLVARQREVGRWIKAHTPAETTVVVAAAGALPYYADRPAIDALGLNDLHIAHLPSQNLGNGKPGHEKSDPAYVLNRRPELIPWAAVPTVSDEPMFLANYRYEEVNGPEGTTLKLFVRKDLPPFQ